jgi:uncharacterized protein YbbC (DUF1343 family)
MKNLIILIILTVIAGTACSAGNDDGKLMTGAERVSEYLPLIKGKSVAIMANQTSIVGGTHLVNTMLSLGTDSNYQKICSRLKTCPILSL